MAIDLQYSNKKELKKIAILLALFASISAYSQDIKILCPFANGYSSGSKEPYNWSPDDKKIVMISSSDTIIRTGVDATVLTVMPSDEGGYQIVIHQEDYYFWYFGVKRPLVSRGQKLKAGQPLATYTLGRELEFRMFLDEEPIDPRQYLDCK